VPTRLDTRGAPSRRRGCAIGALAVVAVVAVAACPGGSRPPPVAPAAAASVRVRVRSFTDAVAVHAVAVAGSEVFTATDDGLDRWYLRTGARRTVTTADGLPGAPVHALAPSADGRALWLIGGDVVARYDLVAGQVRRVATARGAPSITDLIGEPTAIAAVDEDAAWVGGPAGLARATLDGARTEGVTAPVTALLVRGDTLWIGTGDAGVVARSPRGELRKFGPDQGCHVARVRLLGELPDGAMIAVGVDAVGSERVAVIDRGRCTSYRLSPGDRLVAAARRRDELILLGQQRLYALALRRDGARRLRREGGRLIPLGTPSGKKPVPPPYALELLDERPPAGAIALATAGDEILVATRDLGTARLRNGAAPARGSRWLRRGEIADGAVRITVACSARDACYVATGGRAAWRFDGDRFTRVGDPRARVLAVADGGVGGIHAIYRLPDETRIRIARVGPDRWTELEPVAIETPGRASELSFAQLGPRGILWIGLRYRDDDGEMRPWGVAEIDLGLAAVAYHHATRDAEELARGLVPIPVDVADAAFVGEEIWLATSQGVARVRGRDVTMYGETNGLASELVRDVATARDGTVFIASRAGIGVFDGSEWRHPRVLRRRVNSLAIGRDGRLWMATPQGVAVFDGARVRRLDSRRGLLEDQVLDVTADRYGRVWALTPQGVSVLTP
jgi:hypothetical protein